MARRGGMLQFTMGTVGLEDPMDKRYFYALNSDGKMVAFIVFVPFLGKNGYMADVTRHGKDAPSGVMETIIYEAFQVFKEEGIGYGSLGVAPLAGLSAESKNPMERLLLFIYDHLMPAMDSGISTARKKSTVPPNGFRPITRTFRNIRRRACSTPLSRSRIPTGSAVTF